jgi:hypothetical protein
MIVFLGRNLCTRRTFLRKGDNDMAWSFLNRRFGMVALALALSLGLAVGACGKKEEADETKTEGAPPAEGTMEEAAPPSEGATKEESYPADAQPAAPAESTADKPATPPAQTDVAPHEEGE